MANSSWIQGPVSSLADSLIKEVGSENVNAPFLDTVVDLLNATTRLSSLPDGNTKARDAVIDRQLQAIDQLLYWGKQGASLRGELVDIPEASSSTFISGSLVAVPACISRDTFLLMRPTSASRTAAPALPEPPNIQQLSAPPGLDIPPVTQQTPRSDMQESINKEEETDTASTKVPSPPWRKTASPSDQSSTSASSGSECDGSSNDTSSSLKCDEAAKVASTRPPWRRERPGCATSANSAKSVDPNRAGIPPWRRQS